MLSVKGLRRLMRVIMRTGLIHMLVVFVCCMALYSVVFWIVEPGINSVWDGLWYCFVASTTIGFGDICPVTAVGRILTVILTLHAVIVIAMIPGVVVSYYTEYLKIKEKETISQFLEKLERLPELSKEELEEIAEKVRRFNMK